MSVAPYTTTSISPKTSPIGRMQEHAATHARQCHPKLVNHAGERAIISGFRLKPDIQSGMPRQPGQNRYIVVEEEQVEDVPISNPYQYNDSQQ